MKIRLKIEECGLFLMVVFCFSCTRGPFDNINDHWSIEDGIYKNIDLNNVDSLQDKMQFMSDMYFYKNKMFLHQSKNLHLVLNYDVKEQLSPILYKIRIHCEKDSLDEIGYIVWDNLNNGIDKNGCEEMMVKSESINLYLWRHCNDNKTFLDAMDGRRDIDLAKFESNY